MTIDRQPLATLRPAFIRKPLTIAVLMVIVTPALADTSPRSQDRGLIPQVHNSQPQNQGHDSKDRDHPSQNQGHGSKDRDHQAQNQGHGSKYRDHQSQNQGHGSKDRDHQSQNQGHDSKDRDHQSQNQGHGSKDRDHQSQNQGHDSKDRDHQSQNQGHDWKDRDHQSQNQGHDWKDHGNQSSRPHHGSPHPHQIDFVGFNRSLQAAAGVSTMALSNADMIVNGAHGSPMRNLVPEGRYSVWGGGDYGRQDTQGHDADLGSMEIGVSTNVGHGVQLNLSVGRDYSKSDSSYGGEATVRGTYVVPEVVVQILDTPFYATATGIYSKGDADIDRGYLSSGSEVQSHGSTDVTTLGGRLRLDWLNAFNYGQAAFTPYTSVGYTQTKIDGYTENGGSFPVQWDGRTDRATTASIGLDGVYTLNARVNLLARIEGDHQFENNGASASVESLGLNTFNVEGQDYKQNWVRASLGAEAKLGAGTGSIVLNGTSEGDNPDYWVAIYYKWLL